MKYGFTTVSVYPLHILSSFRCRVARATTCVQGTYCYYTAIRTDDANNEINNIASVKRESRTLKYSEIRFFDRVNSTYRKKKNALAAKIIVLAFFSLSSKYRAKACQKENRTSARWLLRANILRGFGPQFPRSETNGNKI